MSRRSSITPELRAALDAAKQARAEQRAAEAPVRAARRKLTERLQSAVRAVDRYNQQVSEALFYKSTGSLLFNSYKLEDAERALTSATATFKSRLIDLMTFDAANNIEGADYPRLAVLDREATIIAGKAEYDRRMAEVRAHMARDDYPPRRTL